MSRRIYLIGVMVLWCLLTSRVAAVPFTNPGPLKPDSSNFVTASLLVIEPGPNVVSAMGHSAIRLECPEHNLDYCFTLENNSDYGLLTFLLGKAPTHDIAIPTADFLKEFFAEKRQVTQHELNLTLHQKQELWRACDIEFTHEGDRQFHYSYDGTDNCTSICYELIEQALMDERIVVDDLPAFVLENNGSYFRHVARRSPWVRFVIITLGGTACDETWNMRNRMAPEMIIPALSQSHLEGSNGKQRPVLTGKTVQLLRGSVSVTPSPASPMLVFGGLLLLALVVTAMQRSRYGRKVAQAFDAFLLTGQSIIGCFLLITCCVGSIVGQHWNWYLIPFNPLPLVLWLCCRKRSWYPQLFIVYSAVLILFLLATPLSSQLDVEHQLITATLLVRTLAAAKIHSSSDKNSPKPAKKAQKKAKAHK